MTIGDTVKTGYVITLRKNAETEPTYLLTIRKEYGIWRANRVENLKTGAIWLPDIVAWGVRAGMLRNTEVAVWQRPGIQQARVISNEILSCAYNRLLEENVRIILMDRLGEPERVPREGGLATLLFEKGRTPVRHFNPARPIQRLTIGKVA